jgi:hypothetical protein
MNNRIVSALVLAGMIASSSAFASKSREMVMGRGGADVLSSYGSFYYDSEYNMFYNPAYVNDFKNWVNIEKGAKGSAEFGFVTSMSNFNLGLFFNRAATGLSTGGATLTGYNTPATLGDNALDLVIGGDAGVKWGFGATYGQSSLTGNQESNLDLRAGVSVNGLDPFIEYKLIGKVKNGGNDVGGQNKLSVGTRYHFGEWVPYAVFKTEKADVEANDDENKNTQFVVGVGRETKLAEGARLVYSLFYANGKQTTKVAGVEGEGKYNILPLNMAIEADVLSWLTIRGGVEHTIFASDSTVRAARDTSARIGGTFHISKVDVDYAFGNGGIDSNDIGFGNSTFHQVALRYTW